MKNLPKLYCWLKLHQTQGLALKSRHQRFISDLRTYFWIKIKLVISMEEERIDCKGVNSLSKMMKRKINVPLQNKYVLNTYFNFILGEQIYLCGQWLHLNSLYFNLKKGIFFIIYHILYMYSIYVIHHIYTIYIHLNRYMCVYIYIYYIYIERDSVFH